MRFKCLMAFCIFILLIIVILFTMFACKDNSANISSSPSYLPVQKPGLSQMEALLEGVILEMDNNGCLRVKCFDDNYLLIWPHGFSMRTEGEEIQVIDSNGQIVACVGDIVNVSGGEVAVEEAEARELIDTIAEHPLPDDCQGPYWIVGEMVEVVYNRSVESGDLVSSDETNEEAELFFAEDYARLHGVTVEEALRRFELQDIAGKLSEDLITKEADTLAGYWIEHTPEFKLVILFTCDAEETIKPYLKKYKELADIIEVGTAKLSLVELQNTQNEISSSIENLGIPVASDINVYENRVKVYRDRPDSNWQGGIRRQIGITRLC